MMQRLCKFDDFKIVLDFWKDLRETSCCLGADISKSSTEEEVLMYLSDVHTCTYIIEEANNPIGVYSYYQTEEESTLAFIFIKEAYRNRGIGTGILKAWNTMNHVTGKASCVLSVLSSNLKAINLYHRLYIPILAIVDNNYKEVASDFD